MRDDLTARQRALDPHTSFIVQAPAGSGKTELLIQRYLRLLETVDSPNSVVAITFTKKAAGEMRARVVDALRRSNPPEQPYELITHQIAQRVLAHQRQLGWNLLSNPAQIRMETIDALCASITRQMPWLARFGAQPDITEKAGPLYRAAARRTLRHLEVEERNGTPGPIWRLLLHVDNQSKRAELLISDQLEKRDHWLRLLGWSEERDLGEIRRLCQERLARLIDVDLTELQTHFDDALCARISKSLGWFDFPGPSHRHLSRWRQVQKEVLTSGGKFRRRGYSDLDSREALREALHNVAKLPDPAYADDQWQLTEAVLQVLPLAVAELRMIFAERGVVDFAELSLRALEALSSLDQPTDLALALGDRIEHLLIDEFQDMSYTQYELVRRLTSGWQTGDGRSLFLVGDPMQSIYGFRQADVSLFLKAREEGIGDIVLEPLRLEMNFRSRPAIVAFVNETCSRAFPDKDNIHAGAITYSHSHAAVPDIDTTVAVHCHAFLNQQTEARHVLQLLEKLPSKGTALLVRARSHLFRIVKLLRQQGIRFRAVEIDSLAGRPVIQDLLALTCALLHPADRISWLSILRAPWCGLTLADLHALAATDHRRPIWDLLSTTAVSGDARERIDRIHPVLKSALESKGRSPLRDWVEETWHRIGGSACLSAQSEREDADAYFHLLASVDEGGDLADFGAFREDVANLFAQPDPTAQDELEVMTIHKAKGLQFDTVILPGLGQTTWRDENPLLRWIERDGETILASISATGDDSDAVYTYLGHWEKLKTRHENCRMLYVAMTRAKNDLHLLGCLTQTANGFKPKSDSFLSLLWPAAAASFVLPDSAGAEAEEVPAREIRRVSKGWTIPAPPPPVRWTPLLLQPASPPEITYEWVGDTLRQVGTTVHQYLQQIGNLGIAQWDPARVSSLREAYRVVLANLGVPPSDLNDATEKVESALLRVLGDQRGRWILSPHLEAVCEFSITGSIDGARYDAVIDRTFIADGIRWIVDYKTSLHSGGKLDNFYDGQVLRYREQLELYARLLQQRDHRPVKLGLYFPLLGGWREWDAPEPERKQARFAF